MKISECYSWACIVIISLVSSDLQARKPLTIEQRIKAQEAIEQVYYSHRIWPKENPCPKPPFEQMVTREQIEAKVTGYLKKSAALDQFWQRPIEGKQLQAEIDRMAKGTKDPATLNELFKALNDDPFLIAECLARPILVDCQFLELFAVDSSILDDWNANPANYETSSINNDETFFLPDIGSTAKIAATTDGWTSTSVGSGVPSARGRHSAVWTGSEMIIWGGSTGYRTNTGGIYTPATDSWKATSIGTNCPSTREHFSAIWTGTEMIIWGGHEFDTNDHYYNDGGRYNPISDSWQSTSTGSNCPSGRSLHSAVWTGTDIIIWGGHDDGFYQKSGGIYNPSSNSWKSTTNGTNCPSGRINHTAIWTGSEMIVWGGYDGYSLNTGARYNPSNDSWLPTSTGTDVPNKREYHSSIWTGSEMIVWGGAQNNTGGKYNPLNDSWEPTSTGTNCPTGRIWHTAVWTGTKMIIWGGSTGSATNTGGIYSPSDDTWIATTTGSNCPSPRSLHTAVWTGNKMIVWGGYASDSYLNSGSIYSSNAPSCTLSCTTNVPTSDFVGELILFDVTATPINCVGTVSYHWDFGDGETATGADPQYSYANVGTYNWSVTASVDGQECSKSGTITISASSVPVIYSVWKGTNPFRLIINGGNYLNQTSAWAWVYINGVAVPQTSYKGPSKIVAKGGNALKAMVPKGVTVQITVKNPDGTYSEPYSFIR